LLWDRLLKDLRARGHYGERESGAFLLGHRRNGRARITQFVLYDDLDPKCLETGIVHFDGRYFGDLWERCNQHGLSVVADVHTHPGSSRQSQSDRAHPMISRAGHIAVIVPRFAAEPVMSDQVGVYRYEGEKLWTPVPAQDRRAFFHIGF
jgi:proteasome lid subunit RPN8/RPN11